MLRAAPPLPLPAAGALGCVVAVRVRSLDVRGSRGGEGGVEAWEHEMQACFLCLRGSEARGCVLLASAASQEERATAE